MVVGSIFKCENMTKKFGNEFSNGFKQAGNLEKIDYFKVLGYSENKARVYYVLKEKEGDEMIFEKRDNQWVVISVKKIWATDGSAKGFEFPYLIR